MYKSLILGAALSFALAPAVLAQQGEQNFDHANFDAVDISGSFQARIEVGHEFQVRLVGAESDFDQVEIEMDRGELDVRQQRGLFGRQRDLDVTLIVTMPSISEAEFSRGVSAVLTGVDADRFDVEVSTGAYAELSGQCSRMDAEVSTGGSLRARSLECESVTAEASTGGEGDVFASQRINAEASTGGGLDIFGSPGARSSETVFGGSIRFVPES